MNTSTMMNALTTQRHGCYTDIPINTSTILNVITTQCRRFYANISMNISPILNVITTQLGTSCSFDSPGLARNEPTPGKRSQGDSTP
ncbi:tetrahydrofolate synthase [Segatella salivae]|uniref:tetrahydrofolate synthase n=1 Tax=Segatella salivae TaxID=228604 RepID=UPI00248EEDCE|nr:tetrahydrofolate synthase [Segatella salivae]